MPALQGHGRRAVCKHLRLPWGNLKRETGRAADLLTLLLAAVPSVCAGWGGEKRIRSIFVPTKHLHPHPCANPCSAPSLPAADRPVMGMHFPQLRALVPGLSSSAWCSQVNERLHNEVITCVRMSAGLAGLQPRPAKPSHLGSPPCPLQVIPTPACAPTTRLWSVGLPWPFSLT